MTYHAIHRERAPGIYTIWEEARLTSRASANTYVTHLPTRRARAGPATGTACPLDLVAVSAARNTPGRLWASLSGRRTVSAICARLQVALLNHFGVRLDATLEAWLSDTKTESP